MAFLYVGSPMPWMTVSFQDSGECNVLVSGFVLASLMGELFGASASGLIA